jgi:hypothetical protein
MAGCQVPALFLLVAAAKIIIPRSVSPGCLQDCNLIKRLNFNTLLVTKSAFPAWHCETRMV